MPDFSDLDDPDRFALTIDTMPNLPAPTSPWVTPEQVAVDFEDPEAWREFAACRGMDLAIFFPKRGESTAHAKKVCASCPVADECLAYALCRGAAQKFGIWGGKSERERRGMRRVDHPRTPARHGTATKYRHGCRCDRCKAAKRRERRAA